MKLVEYYGDFVVLDNLDRPAVLSKVLTKPQNIFGASWVRLDDGFVDNYVRLTPDVSSFKALKHEVAKYLLDKGITEGIPTRYVQAYNRNK